MVNLSKGQTISLEKRGGGTLTRVRMGLGWDAMKKKGMFGKLKDQSVDLDASALLFDSNRQLVDQVWFQQLRSKDGSVQHTGDNLTGAGEGDDESIVVDLQSVPADIHQIVFVVNSFTGQNFSQIENAFCRLVDDGHRRHRRRADVQGPAADGHPALVTGGPIDSSAGSRRDSQVAHRRRQHDIPQLGRHLRAHGPHDPWRKQ